MDTKKLTFKFCLHVHQLFLVRRYKGNFSLIRACFRIFKINKKKKNGETTNSAETFKIIYKKLNMYVEVL